MNEQIGILIGSYKVRNLGKNKNNYVTVGITLPKGTTGTFAVYKNAASGIITLIPLDAPMPAKPSMVVTGVPE
jgi:hypothetical protein